MRELLLMRHAKSSWDHPDFPDHERPLNARGQHDAPRMGRLLLQWALAPDLILSSSARRARLTALTVAIACQYEGEICLARNLYAAPAAAYLKAIGGVAGNVRRLLVVGHNPGLEQLFTLLTGREEPLPTAAIAVLGSLHGGWGHLGQSPADIQLFHLWRPKDVALPD